MTKQQQATETPEPSSAHTSEPKFRHGMPLDVSVYQCECCGFQRTQRQVVEEHARRKHTGEPRIAHAKFSMVPVENGQLVPLAQIHTNSHNHSYNKTYNINIVNVHAHPGMAYVGSEEERAALRALFRNQDFLNELATLPPEEIPAVLFRWWKGADAPQSLKNITVVGNKVQEHRGPDHVVSVPRAKFLNKTVGDMIDTVTTVPPTSSADPERLSQVQEQLQVQDLAMGKKRRVSRQEAVLMRATGSRDVYSLGPDALKFITDSTAMVDRELDYYAQDARGGGQASPRGN